MLALAILSIGIFVLIECTARCLAVIRVARNYQTARQVLDQGELDYPLLSSNTLEQNMVAPVSYPNGYSFARELTPLDGEANLYLIKTRVAWSERGQSAGEEVTSLLYCPANDFGSISVTRTE